MGFQPWEALCVGGLQSWEALCIAETQSWDLRLPTPGIYPLPNLQKTP